MRVIVAFLVVVFCRPLCALPIDVMCDDGNSIDLASWTGAVSEWSPGFAGGSYDVVGSGGLTWQQVSDGTDHWWYGSDLNASLHLTSPGGDWLMGTGTLEMTVYAEDSSFTAVQVWGAHSLQMAGLIHDGMLGHDGAFAGHFTLASTPFTDPVVSGGVPAGPASFIFGPLIAGDVVVPEPHGLALVVIGAIAMLLHFRRSAGRHSVNWDGK